MSLTGSIYKASEKELENYKSNISWNPSMESRQLYLDSFFYDLYEILTKYTGFAAEEMAPLIEGQLNIRKDEVTIGYSLPDHVAELNARLDKISIDEFDLVFDNALKDEQSYVHFFKDQQVYIDGIRQYFQQLKEYFKEANEEKKCLLHIIG